MQLNLISTDIVDQIIRYWQYYFRADTIFNVHSPFVYDFITNVLDTRKQYYAFNALEHERRMLLANHSPVRIEDHGAGSRKKDEAPTVSSIAKKVVSPPAKCRTLFNLVNYFRPPTILELGTSLGLSALYMSKANQASQLYTIEGATEIYRLAKLLFEKNHATNIHVYKGTFDDQLPGLLNILKVVDLAYIDGHHNYAATITNFNTILPYTHKSSIIVLDDIYWSAEMTRAWNEIKAMPQVAMTIDTFDFGFVFFNSEMEKQHFTLIDYRKKPWRIGLFG